MEIGDSQGPPGRPVCFPRAQQSLSTPTPTQVPNRRSGSCEDPSWDIPSFSQAPLGNIQDRESQWLQPVGLLAGRRGRTSSPFFPLVGQPYPLVLRLPICKMEAT